MREDGKGAHPQNWYEKAMAMGEAARRELAELAAAHPGQWIVTAIWGKAFPAVPPGHVLVRAQREGRESCFLIPQRQAMAASVESRLLDSRHAIELPPCYFSQARRRVLAAQDAPRKVRLSATERAVFRLALEAAKRNAGRLRSRFSGDAAAAYENDGLLAQAALATLAQLESCGDKVD